MFDRTKPDGQPRRSLDVTRARNSFGFAATTDFRAGLKRTIEWYQAQRTCPSRETLLLQSILLARSGGHGPAADRACRRSRRPPRVPGVSRGRTRAARRAAAPGSLLADQPVRREERAGVRILRANGTAFPRQPLCRPRQQLPELFRVGVCRQLAAGPAGRRRVADRSADPRPRRAVDRAPRRRALRVSVRGHFPGGRVAPRRLPQRDRQPRRSIASTGTCSAKPTPSSRSAIGCAGAWSRRKAPIPARVHVIHNWADCEAIAPGAEGQRVRPRARARRSVRR